MTSVAKIWGWTRYNKELTSDGQYKPINAFEKVCIMVINPILMIIVFLNVFGFIQ